MSTKGNFIIRVYGLITNENNEVLLSDEYQLDTWMTKFPGGGLEFSEGPVDCLRREIGEECNGQELKNIQHFYTTGFYQKAQFFENAQLISIYYRAQFIAPLRFQISRTPFNFDKPANGMQSFRWEKISTLKEEDFTFPIDKFVVNSLKSNYFENR